MAKCEKIENVSCLIFFILTGACDAISYESFIANAFAINARGIAIALQA